MTLRVVSKTAFFGTDRHVRNDVYETVRLLLAADGAGAGLTDIVLQPDIAAVYGYPDRIEIAYCIAGRADVTDLVSGLTATVEPGTLWVATPPSRFRFVAAEPTRLICVFLPALEGTESGFADAADGQPG